MLKTYPLSLGNFIEVKGRKIYGLYIIARNIPGVLASISKILSSKDVNIIELNFSPEVKRGAEVGLFFALDFTESKAKVEEVVEEIRKEGFEKAEVVKPFNNMFLANTFNFPLMDGEERGVLLSKIDLEIIVVGIRRRFGLLGLNLLYK